MPTTKIVLFQNKAKKNGQAPLYLRIIKNRKPKYVSLKLYVEPKYWDEDKEKVKSGDKYGHPNATRMNNYILEKTRLALDALLEKETFDPGTPLDELQHTLHGTSPVDFFEFGYKFIKKYETQGKIGTYRRFNTVLNKFKVFVGDGKLFLHQLTMPLLKKYENDLRTTHENQNNTVIANFRALRRIMNEAVAEKKIQIARNPFLGYKLSWQNTEKTFLTEAELEKIENKSLKEGSLMYHHRNMYVFACYAGGVRISDLITLRWANFDGTHLLLNTKKTGSTISIKLPAKALEIIKIYQKKDSKKEDFVFPFLDRYPDISTPDKLHNAISSITAYTKRLFKIYF